MQRRKKERKKRSEEGREDGGGGGTMNNEKSRSMIRRKWLLMKPHGEGVAKGLLRYYWGYFDLNCRIIKSGKI